jgi:hypothetical protein
MNIIGYDIRSLIISYMDSIKEFFNFRHICKLTFYEHYTLLNSNRSNPNIIIKGIRSNNYENTYFNCEHIISLTLNIFGSYTKKKFQFPDTINLPNLEYLHVSYIHGKSLSKFPNLKVLKCNYVCHNLKDKDLIQLPKLIYLDCISKQFTNDLLQYIPNLTYLKINQNKTSFTIDGYKYLTKLEVLDGVHVIPVNLFKVLPNLRYAYCNNTYQDNDIINRTNLRTLICGYNSQISALSIRTLTNLTDLTIYDHINITDNDLNKLTKLNEVTIIPTLIGDCLLSLTNLTSINICNNLNINDKHLVNLINLKLLICNVNITDLTLLNLNKLEMLDCVCNKNFTEKCLMSLHLKIFDYHKLYPNDDRIKKYVNMLKRIKYYFKTINYQNNI